MGWVGSDHNLCKKTLLTPTSSWIKVGKDRENVVGKRGRGEERGEGRKWKGEDPRCLTCVDARDYVSAVFCNIVVRAVSQTAEYLRLSLSAVFIRCPPWRFSTEIIPSVVCIHGPHAAVIAGH